MVIIDDRRAYNLPEGLHLVNGIAYTVTSDKVYKTTLNEGTKVLYPQGDAGLAALAEIELKGVAREIAAKGK